MRPHARPALDPTAFWTSSVRSRGGRNHQPQSPSVVEPSVSGTGGHGTGGDEATPPELTIAGLVEEVGPSGS